MQLETWLEDLAAKKPTPGGGAAAGLAAAISAALLGMVSIYTLGPKWQDRAGTMEPLNQRAAELRATAQQLMDADEAAFAQVGAAYKLVKETDAEKAKRTAAIQAALIAAAEPPRQVTVLAAELVILAQQLVATGNPNVISDVAVAASCARTALEAAIVNIEINQQLIQASDVKATLQQAINEAEKYLKQADSVITAVRQRIRNGA